MANILQLLELPTLLCPVDRIFFDDHFRTLPYNHHWPLGEDWLSYCNTAGDRAVLDKRGRYICVSCGKSFFRLKIQARCSSTPRCRLGLKQKSIMPTRSVKAGGALLPTLFLSVVALGSAPARLPPLLDSFKSFAGDVGSFNLAARALCGTVGDWRFAWSCFASLSAIGLAKDC